MSQTTQSKLDQEPTLSVLKADILGGETNAYLARKYSTSEKSIRRFRVRHGVNPKSFEPGETFVDEQEGVGHISTPSSTVRIVQDPDEMIRQRGLDPEEWTIGEGGMRVNEYEGPAPKGASESKITYYQTRFNIVKKSLATPFQYPRTDGWIAPPKAAVRHDMDRLVVIVGDQQVPFHDKGLHECFLSWLNYNEPDQGVSLGDTYDFPDIRPGHRVYAKHNAKVNECLQAGYDLFRDYVDASDQTHWTKLFGNHDDRFKNFLLDKPSTREVAEWKRPDRDGKTGEELHDLAFAGCLDELGIDCVDTGGSYENGQVNLSKYLAVRHGWIARKGAGSSALATLESTRYSIVVGHTHRQSIVYHTSANIDGEINTLTAAEAGCMCRVSQVPAEDGRVWPGYTVAPDWQQGFMTATIWPDGKFHLDPAVFVDGTLLWRDQRFEV